MINTLFKLNSTNNFSLREVIVKIKLVNPEIASTFVAQNAKCYLYRTKSGRTRSFVRCIEKDV